MAACSVGLWAACSVASSDVKMAGARAVETVCSKAASTVDETVAKSAVSRADEMVACLAAPKVCSMDASTVDL